MKNIKKAKICVFTIIALSANSALSWSYINCNDTGGVKWNSNKLEYKYSDYNFKPNSSWLKSLKKSVKLFNNNPSKLRASLTGKTRKAKRNNKQNDIWFSNAITVPADAPTVYDCNTGKITEADIRINAKLKTYTTSLKKDILSVYGGKKSSFVSVMLHEMGHSAGLGHTNDTYSVMGSNWNFLHANKNLTRPYLGADATKGLVSIYGRNSGKIEDISVSHWRYNKASGEYSTHMRTRIYDSSKKKLKSSIINGEPVYHASAGSKVYVEFTYENNGERAQTFDVDYLLSSDSSISAKDRDIGGRTNMYLPASTVFTRRLPVSIPYGLKSGRTYYLGAHVDSKDEVDEVADQNNYTYIAVKIK